MVTFVGICKFKNNCLESAEYTNVKHIVRLAGRLCRLYAINRRLWLWRSRAGASLRSRTDASGSSDRNCGGTSRQACHRPRRVRPSRTPSRHGRRRRRQPRRCQTADETGRPAVHRLRIRQTPLTSRLQRILPPKMPFFVRQKVQISSNILPQIPNFAIFFAIRKRGPFSSV